MGKEQTLTIIVTAPEVGHGNPFSAISIAAIALGIEKEKENLVFLNGLGQKLGGIFYGVLALGEFLIKERLPLQKISDIGIFVQEHLLKMISENLLRRWFPSGSFLAVPDVEPKKSAVEILNEKKRCINSGCLESSGI
jgi:hypothetical protein